MTDTERFWIDKEKETKKILQEWLDQTGHNKCWYYPELFMKLCELYGLMTKVPELPPLTEFKAGCEQYQKEVYSDKFSM